LLGAPIDEKVDLKKPHRSQVKKLTDRHYLQFNTWLSHLFDRNAKSVNTNPD
jgi:hypothetical protein